MLRGVAVTLSVFLLLPFLRTTSVMELRNSFYLEVEETEAVLRGITGAVLYQSDLMFWSEIGGSNATSSINSSVFNNFTAIAHTPVSVATIILPDLLSGQNGIGNATRQRLLEFRNILTATSIEFADRDQQVLADAILGSVSTFVDEILNDASAADMQRLEEFARDLEENMRRAAEIAVEDYFMRLVELSRRLNIAFNWSVVLSVEEFSHEGSFLHQFYERVFFQVLYKNPVSSVDKRIVLLPGGLCSSNMSALATQLKAAASNQIFRNTTHNIFNYGSSIHSILADAADKVICSGRLGVSVECPFKASFPGFNNIWDRVYVVLIVLLFSVALFLFILLVSIFSEDRIVKMENSDKPPKKKKLKKEKPEENGHHFGPHLLEPIGGAEYASSYITYRELKKKHSSGSIGRNGRHSQVDAPNGGDSEVSRRRSYSPNHDEDDNVPEEQRPRGVTRTEVTLEDMSECLNE